MTALTAGTSKTFTLRDTGSVTISTSGGIASIVATPTGGTAQTTILGPTPSRLVVGPFAEGATVVVTNQSATLDYDQPYGSLVTLNDAGTALVSGDGTFITPSLQRKLSNFNIKNPPRNLYPLSNVAGTATTTTTGTVAAAANPVIPVTSAAGISLGSILEITSTDGTVFRGMVTLVAALNITCNGTLVTGLASGATVRIWGIKFTTVATIASPLHWPAVTLDSAATSKPYGQYFTDLKGGFFPRLAGPTYPNYLYSVSDDITVTPAPTYAALGTHKAMLHQGSAIEFFIKGVTGSFVIKVDDQYINLSPYATPNDGGIYYIYIPFGFSALRRVEFIGYNTYWGGVYTAQTDYLRPAPARGPKTVVIGASFTEGTGSTGNSPAAFPALLGEYLGWERITASGVGSTGYLSSASGTKPTYIQRIAHDIPADTDVVIFAGEGPGINDYNVNATAAQIQTAAAACFAATRALVPNALIIACGAWSNGGVKKRYRNSASTPASVIAIDEAIKAAAATVLGCYFQSLFTLPLPSTVTPLAGTLQASITAGAGTFSSSQPFSNRMTIQIGDERAEVLSQVGAGPYTVTISGVFAASYANGTAVTQVGDCLWTGVGLVTGTTGYGNSDVFISSDGTHPSDAGHQAIAYQMAQQINTLLQAITQ